MNVSEWLDGDYAYISNLSIAGKSTGSQPFDDDDTPGDDSSANNDIIRSFDTATYSVRFVTTSYDDQDYFQNGRVGFRFILDKTDEDIARFDLDSMLWVDQEPGYEPQIETDDDTGQTILTCYRRLETTSSVPNVIPSTNTVNVVIETRAATNGTEINLDVESWCEHNETNGECAKHDRDEIARTAIPTLTVSAAPRYNIQIDEIEDQIVGYGDWDFDDESLMYGDAAMNVGAGTVHGRLYGYGITLQLYNDTPEKRLKGIELPTGPISFQLDISSKLKHYGDDEFDVTEDYTPLVWSFGENNEGTPIDACSREVEINGQDMSFALSAAPFNRMEGGSGEDHSWYSACYDGGTWYGEQVDNTVFVTVDDYEINLDSFPYADGGSGGEYHRYYAGDEVQNIGCFSAGELFIVQTFNNDETGESFFDEFDYSNGDFTVTVVDSHMRAESVSGQETYDDGNANQTNTDDDEAAMTQSAYISTEYNLRIVYSYSDNEKAHSEGTDRLNYMHNYSDGTDSALPGAELRILGGYEVETFQHENDIVASDILVKFDDAVLEYDPSRPIGVRGDNTEPDRTVFAAKADGTGWIDDDEQRSTKWDELVYYESYQDLLDDGAVCVGLMYETRTVQDEISEHDIRASFPVKVKDDAEIRYVAMTTAEVLLWQRSQITDDVADYFGKDADDLEEGDYNEWLANEFPSVADGIDLEPSIDLDNGHAYEKTVYDDTGLVHDHSGTNRYGDSLLIIGEKMIVDKHVAQSSNGEHKEIFDIDYAQRYVDYTIVPAFDVEEKPNADSGYTTTVTVTDIIPQGLTYVPGSSYLGGTYTEKNGGQTPGIITGGTEFEPNARRNNDGLVELEWTFKDVPYADEFDEIHFTCLIGTPGDSENDVRNNDQIVNNVEIRSTNDIRDIRPEYMNTTGCTIRISKNMSQSLAIRPVPLISELDSEVSFIETLSNYSATSKSEVGIYLLPYNGDGMSSFAGDYKTVSMTVDNNDDSALKFYVTTDASIRSRDLRDIERDDVEHDWIECGFNQATGVVDIPNGGEDIIAWCVIDDDMVSDERIDVTTTLLPHGNETGDAYGSSLCDGDNIVTATLYVVGRTVSGHVFIDVNDNDAYDDGEQLFENATVRLVDYERNTVEALDGNECEMSTGENGYYEFTAVPTGDFSIEFKPADDEDWYHFSAVATDAADDDVDSDATPIIDNNRLTGAVIDGISMPPLENIVGDGYHSEHNDLGLRIGGVAGIGIIKKATAEHQESCKDKGEAAHVGDTITYTATITNTGSATLSDVWVDDGKLGIGKKVVSERLEPGKSIDVAIGAYVVKESDVVAGSVTNNATTNGTPPRYVTPPDDADDDVETPVNGSPEIEITKSTNITLIENPQVGDVIPYTLIITNVGNVTISNITVHDVLSDIGDVQLEKNILAVGESMMVNVEHKLTQDDIDDGEVRNMATTSGEFGDETSTDESNEVVTELIQTPEISLIKSTEDEKLDAVRSVVGETISYDFVIENTGNVTLHDVELKDHLTDVYALVIDWESSSDKSTDDGILSVGESVSATAKYDLTQIDIDAGNVLNTATVEGTSPDDEMVDDDSSANTVLTGIAAIDLVKSTIVTSIDAEHAVAGTEIPYAFTITNTGAVTLHDVTLTDEMLTDTGVTISIDWDNSSDPSTSAGVLSPNETVNGTATYAITDDDITAGTVINEASVIGTPDNGEPASDDDTVTTDIAQAKPYLSIIKQSDVELVSSDDAVAGTVVSWTLVVTNDGNVTIDDIEIDDSLPTANVLVGEFDGTLEPDESVELKVEYVLTDDDIDGCDKVTTTISNTASAKGIYHGDKQIKSNESTDTIDVRRNPSIKLEKSVDTNRIENDDVKVGAPITYTFVVTNIGDMTVNATKIIDSIEGLDINLVGVPEGTPDVQLSPGESISFTATYRITQNDIDTGKVINTAYAEGELVDDTVVRSNEDDAVTDIVKSAHISIRKDVDIEKIENPSVGDILMYSFAIMNDGDVTLENVGISDDKQGLSQIDIDWSTSTDDSTADGVLSPNEMVNATATYAITQADIDAGSVMNEAKSFGDTVNEKKHVESVPDDAVTVLLATSHIAIEKNVDIDLIDDAHSGDVLTYSFVVKNDGNTTLTDIGIDDELGGISEVTFDWDSSSDTSTGDCVLSPNETVNATATYVITNDDINAGYVINTAMSYGWYDGSQIISAPDTAETKLRVSETIKVDSSDDIKPLRKQDDTVPMVSTGISSNIYIIGSTIVSVLIAVYIIGKKLK